VDFGYFTLSDNRYQNNTRTPEQFITDIYAEALYAEEIGLHSAWIGEHHFNLLGVNASPDILLSQIAGATKRIRLAPAVVLLPIHHPLHVAERWATLDLLSGGRVEFAAGRGYDIKEYTPFGIPFGESADIASLMRYFHEALIGAFPSDPKTVPATYKYFIEIVDIMKNMKAESLTSRSILVGSPQKIIDDLKTVEQSGISEVILYFNYGLKPHSLVKEQMAKFMELSAPAFDGEHKRFAAV
jgi:hypothetical protein